MRTRSTVAGKCLCLLCFCVVRADYDRAMVDHRTLDDVAELAVPVAEALMPGGRQRVESTMEDLRDDAEVDTAEAAQQWGADVERSAQALALLRADVDGLPLQDSYGAPLSHPLQQRVAMALVALGFTIHDCNGLTGPAASRAGGVCLLVLTEGGVCVTWTSHDVAHASEAGGLETVARDLNREMNELLGAQLVRVGFTVEPFGTGGAYQVTAAPADGWNPGLGG